MTFNPRLLLPLRNDFAIASLPVLSASRMWMVQFMPGHLAVFEAHQYLPDPPAYVFYLDRETIEAIVATEDLHSVFLLKPMLELTSDEWSFSILVNSIRDDNSQIAHGVLTHLPSEEQVSLPINRVYFNKLINPG